MQNILRDFGPRRLHFHTHGVQMHMCVFHSVSSSLLFVGPRVKSVAHLGELVGTKSNVGLSLKQEQSGTKRSCNVPLVHLFGMKRFAGEKEIQNIDLRTTINTSERKLKFELVEQFHRNIGCTFRKCAKVSTRGFIIIT